MGKKLVIIFFIALSFCSFAEEKLIFNNIEGKLGIISMQVLTKAYNKLGYDVEFRNTPAKRGLIESNRGRKDGEVHRIKGIEKRFSNLVFIKIPINFYETRVFSKNHDYYLKNLEMLKKYSFSTTRGVINFEKLLEGFNVTTVNEVAHNYKLLNAGRIDFVLGTDITGLHIICKNNYKGIKMLDPAIETTYLYHYLHKKHANLGIKISEILESMEKSGEIREIRDNYIKTLNLNCAD